MKLRAQLLYSFSVALPKFDYTPPPYTGIPFEQVVADRQQYCPALYFHYYKDPLLIAEGRMQYLFDHKGNRYQDWFSGISTVSIGHSHPKLVAAMKDQA